MKSEGLVTCTTEIRENVESMFRYAQGTSAEREFHRGRIKNGKNFVALAVNGRWLFAPSKFAGYAGNDPSHMQKLQRRDGGVTNKRISDLIGLPLSRGDDRYTDIDLAYEAYVREHGFSPSAHRQGRKYWIIS